MFHIPYSLTGMNWVEDDRRPAHNLLFKRDTCQWDRSLSKGMLRTPQSAVALGAIKKGVRMEYKVIGSVFTMIFLAELGDKTQLATFACAAYERSKISVFIGSSLALVLASLIATLLGAFLAQHVPQSYISRTAGALFMIMGAYYIYKG